ncbi:DAHP synthetase I/KDSA [Shewanella denitrificans OS217]|jgi:chorismate mutase|uniref:DAHP synthetase I/KDSA n=1 Tax=Shewanella denitrificans (strain OS217 / ATCC BAA-1090 / DSM 15013) TaxID=318161 RepID=Q12RL4_SHEDO|nr:phospho-2-dehydro-3-deoxyheptonate aldolase [Shewanella denitrificans]ABE53912.1 DAHP synthetase I/KDSA [Shewanella denitrificans OS217]
MSIAKKLKSSLLSSLLNKGPLFIAGPCSAETKKQLLQTAHSVKASGAQVIRAGIWKPRTRPGKFEGVGEQGLEWLAQAKEETGLPITTEVANAAHVKLALEYGLDMLWIGARTTVSPFAIQEIADALAGNDIPVLIKNPINPDIELWIGAIERIQAAGITEIAGIHRGFSTVEKFMYRNPPIWEIPIELKNRLPDLPIICDPSHISGNREFIKLISELAIGYGFNGLMIESHIDPDNAWSDAKQQITPKELEIIISQILSFNKKGSKLFDKKVIKEHLAFNNEINKEYLLE